MCISMSVVVFKEVTKAKIAESKPVNLIIKGKLAKKACYKERQLYSLRK